MITRDNFIEPGKSDGYMKVTPEVMEMLFDQHGFKEDHREGNFSFNIPKSMWEEFLGIIDFP